MPKIRSSSVASAKSAIRSLGKHGFGAIPTRFLVFFLSAFTNLLSYTIRTNFSVTIVAMVNTTSDLHFNNNSCLGENANQTNAKSHGEFEWSDSVQGVVLGAYYYGYILTNVNGGQLADWIGARWLVGLSILISGSLTLLTPIASRTDVVYVIALRILIGLVQGVLTPSLYTMLAHWTPQNERSTVLALIQVGGNIGAVLTLPLSGFLSEHGFDGGWPSVFYLLGAAGVVMFFPWMYMVYNTPDEHPRISGKELLHIQAHVTVSSSKSGRRRKAWVPWGAILTSPRVWVVAITKFCGAWGNLMLMSKLAGYLHTILGFPIEKNGIVNALVYISMSVSLMVFGYASDFIGRKRLLSQTVSRKVFEAIALGGPAICMAAIPWVGCDQTLVVVLLIVAMAIYGFAAGGEQPIVVDIAPDYSGTIYGLTNAVASVPGFLAPLFVGVMLDNNPSSPRDSWSYIFYTSSGIYIFGALVFGLFISAKPEPWGRARAGTVRSTIDASYIISPRGSVFIEDIENQGRRINEESSRQSSRAPSRPSSRPPSRPSSRPPSRPSSAKTSRKSTGTKLDD